MKFLIAFIFTIVSLFSTPAIADIVKVNLMEGQTGVATGTGFKMIGPNKTFHVKGATSSGSGTATVLVQCANSPANSSDYGLVATVSLASISTTLSGDILVSDSSYEYCRLQTTAISGTGTAITGTVGVER